MMVRTFDALSIFISFKKSGSRFCILHRTNRDFLSGRDCRPLDVFYLSHTTTYIKEGATGYPTMTECNISLFRDEPNQIQEVCLRYCAYNIFSVERR